MIIWLFITVMVLFMAPTILKIFRVPNPDNYSAKYIFVKVWNIVSCVSTWITSVVTDYSNNNPFWDPEYPVWMTETAWTYNIYNDNLTVYDL